MVEFPQDHGTFRGNEYIATCIVKGPDLHVGTVDGIPQVHGVVQDDARIVAALQLLANPSHAIAPHLRKVWQ
ncbi:hypothetical protein D9M72_557350 [compost metagenome]